MVTEYLTDAERAEFLSGLDAIDEIAKHREGTHFAMISQAATNSWQLWITKIYTSDSFSFSIAPTHLLG